MSNYDPKNPLGILAIDHLEFCTDSLKTPTIDTFYKFGFEKTYENTSINAELYSQGQIRFVILAHPDINHPSVKYFKNHGEGVCKISFLVENAEHAITEALSRGAELKAPLTVIESEHGPSCSTVLHRRQGRRRRDYHENVIEETVQHFGFY